MRVSALQTGPAGYLILGAWVFAEQLGLPLPATPALLAAGALAAEGRLNLALTLATAVSASMLADYLWYRAGVLGSGAIHRFLLRNPRSKMLRLAEQIAARHGIRTLVFAKFVPCLSLAAPPFSGLSGTGAARFLIFDGLGSFIWAGFWIGLGYCFGAGGTSLLPPTPRSCAWICAALAIGLAAFRLAGKLWNKLREPSLAPAIDERLVRRYQTSRGRLTWLSSLIANETECGPDPVFHPLCPWQDASPFFQQWSNVWFRKLVIAKVLGRVAAELKDSARRTAILERPPAVSPSLRFVNVSRFESALLALDLFPRCVILLTMLEQLSIQDVIVLLDADKDLIRTAQAIGIAALSRSLSDQPAWQPEPAIAPQPALAEMQP